MNIPTAIQARDQAIHPQRREQEQDNPKKHNRIIDTQTQLLVIALIQEQKSHREGRFYTPLPTPSITHLPIHHIRYTNPTLQHNPNIHQKSRALTASLHLRRKSSTHKNINISRNHLNAQRQRICKLMGLSISHANQRFN